MLNSVTSGLPRVIVPVLSKITVFARERASKDANFLTIIRFFAAALTPPKRAIGVAKIKGHGVATTKTAKTDSRFG